MSAQPSLPANVPEALARAIAAELDKIRCPLADEFQLHDVVEQVLARMGVVAAREHRFSKADRVDFFIPAAGLAIEVKVKGTPSEVLLQLCRYAQHEEVAAILLVTGRHRLAQTVPPTLNRKPIVKASLWKGGL
jgi:hypothetical protein